MDAVQKGTRVINLSLSGSPNSAITAAIKEALINQVIVVAASGNEYASTVSYPASLVNVIAVGATQGYDHADFSNYGSELDVVAPGVSLLSTTLNHDYGTASGTSFSAPQVSALAGLIASAYPYFSLQEVIHLIKSTASLYPSRTNEIGYGMINPSKALFQPMQISGPSPVPLNSTVTYSVSVPAGVTFNGWTISGSTSSYRVTGGTNNPSLTITIVASGGCLLNANFTMPDGSTYSTWSQPVVINL